MNKKYTYVITILLVVAWFYLVIVNSNIPTLPLKQFFSGELSFSQTIDEVSSSYPVDIKEKYSFINLNGLFVRLIGGRECNEIVKLKNGSLTAIIDSYDTSRNAQKVISLCQQLHQDGIDFLYVQFPYKTNSELIPYGLTNHVRENSEAFLYEIRGTVPCMDLRSEFTDNSEVIDKYFYKTDHHWNPLGAFKAFQIISQQLQSNYPNESIYGFYQNIDNWDINKKSSWFLGSRGKRTGKYFAGIDDLIWLTPKFDTQMSMYNVYSDELFSGDYFDANIRQEYISSMDLFEQNPYCIYIGGDYALVQHRNASAPSSKKILLLKDSFMLPLQTYFSTVFKEVDVIDMRHFDDGTLYEYIKKAQPDIVIMGLYEKSLSNDSYFEFGVSTD